MIRKSVSAAMLVLLLAAAARAEEPQAWVEKNLPELVELYKHFHQHPELSFHEEQTALRLGEELKAVGAEVTQEVGGTGVVAVLRNGEGPTVMLRTDLDALPVVEETGVPYASTVRVEDERGAVVGVMHACGHDIHITNLIGVARYMAANKDRWQGTLVMIGQPAEERGAGARAMLDDGLFQRFARPDYAIALHVDSSLRSGDVGLRGGYSLANVDSVDITINGRGGHGAYPHATIDPIVIAARLVLDLQTIVAREIKPIEPAVVTVGSIHGGTKHNIIGDTCHLQLTVRSYSDQVRQHLYEAIQRKAKAAAASAGAPEPEIAISEGTPSLFNDEELAARMRGVFEQALGEAHVKDSEPSMGGEDFSHYGRAGVPILMFRLGAVNEARLNEYARQNQPPPSLHSPIFYPDPEPALKTGLVSMASAALDLLKKQP
ncbi:MAG: amidohydrolase [Pirellulales bacterium]